MNNSKQFKSVHVFVLSVFDDFFSSVIISSLCISGCFLDNLLIDYQFTFSLLQEDDRHYTAINFMATPEQVTLQLRDTREGGGVGGLIS